MSRELADKLILATGAEIRHHGTRAFYTRPVGDWPNHRHGDYITMPPKSFFKDENYYYQVLFHELAHYSECRVGSLEDPQINEAVADMASYLVCTALGIPFHWDQTTRNNAEVVENAMRIANFILSGSPSDAKIEDQWIFA
jgi:antirestriction protein ArdC